MHGVWVVEAKRCPEPLPQHVERLAGDVERIGHDQREIARLAAELRPNRVCHGHEILRHRTRPGSIGLDLQPDKPLRPALHRHGGEFVEVFAGKLRRRPRNADAPHPAPALDGTAKHPEITLAGDGREIDDLQTVPQVGGVVAEPLHAFIPREPRQRERNVEPEDLPAGPLHERLDHAHHVVGLDERHLDVELRELGLAVGPQVFVAETLRHLHVAVEAGHHQQLLVELRRLRQGEEGAVFEPARHEVVAGPLGRAAAEHRRFHVDEAERVEVVAHDLHHPAPQEHVVVHRRTTQVEPAVCEPHLLARQVRRSGLEDRRLRLVEHLDLATHHLGLTRSQLRVGGAGGAGTDRPPGADHPLGPHGAGRGERGRRALGADHDLRLPPAVAEVDEDHSFVVADAVDPAAEGHLRAEVAQSKFAAGVGSKHGMHLFPRGPVPPAPAGGAGVAR